MRGTAIAVMITSLMTSSCDRQRSLESEDLEIASMIDASGGHDYAGAADVLRRSGRPEDVRRFQIGMLAIQSFEQKGAVRPPETLEQGLRMAEDAILMDGDIRRTGPQQLRLLFERGGGRPPDTVPVDMRVADCWRRLEHGGPGDPAVCVLTRREEKRPGG